MKKNNLERIQKYLAKYKIENWTAEEVLKMIKENDTKAMSLFVGWETGNIEFNQSKNGRKYIQIVRPSRLYLD